MIIRSACALVLLLWVAVCGASPLHNAAMNGDGVRLKALLDSQQYDVNEKDQNGRTPLAAAFATCSSYTGRFPKTVPGGALVYCEPGITLTVAALLICAGADVNVDVFPTRRPGYKLVHIAACHGSDALDFLLAAGADPNAPYTLPANNQTITPLTWAVTCTTRIKNNTEYGYPQLKFQTLLAAGANPLPNGASNTPSSLLYKAPFPLSKCNTPGICTQADIDKLADDVVNIYNNVSIGDWLELWLAQERTFKDPKAAPEDQPTWASQTTKMEYACQYADAYYNSELAMLQDMQTAEQYASLYPLHAAVMSNNLSAVRALVEAPGWWWEPNRPGVHSKDNNGLTPLQVGMDCNKGDVWCWPRVDTDVVEYLVSKGANVRLDVNPKDLLGYTLLHKAAFHSLTGIVKALLNGNPTSKADPNAIYYAGQDMQPVTPLAAAAACDFRRSMGDEAGDDSTNGTVMALLAAGAKPMPFGASKPLSSYFTVPEAAKKCNTIGQCTEAEARAAQKYFVSGSCPASWMLLWQAQNNVTAAVAAETAVAATHSSTPLADTPAGASSTTSSAVAGLPVAPSATTTSTTGAMLVNAATATAKPACITGRRSI